MGWVSYRCNSGRSLVQVGELNWCTHSSTRTGFGQMNDLGWCLHACALRVVCGTVVPLLLLMLVMEYHSVVEMNFCTKLFVVVGVYGFRC